MREYVKGDFLFLDTDTVIADKLPDIVSDHDIAMVRDQHGTMIERGTVDHFRNLFEKCHYPSFPPIFTPSFYLISKGKCAIVLSIGNGRKQCRRGRQCRRQAMCQFPQPI